MTAVVTVAAIIAAYTLTLATITALASWADTYWNPPPADPEHPEDLTWGWTPDHELDAELDALVEYETHVGDALAVANEEEGTP